MIAHLTERARRWRSAAATVYDRRAVITAFSFEHVFRAPSTTAILAAYFDPDHLATQDQLAGLGDRVVVESNDDGAVLARSWRVTAHKPLPVVVRPFVAGGRLHYLEAMRWRRADDAVDATVVPELLGGRVRIEAVYQLAKLTEGQIRRRYTGTIAVDITLLGSRIERGILKELEQSMPMMAACTQAWLDRAAT